MTREEAVIILDGFKNNPLFNSTHAQALDMAISNLSESKGDLISRQAVENITWEEPSYTDPLNVLTEVREKVRALPSVENKGEWIYDKSIYNWKCSRCGQAPKTMGYVGTADFMTTHFKFCNHCGARMEGCEE